MISASIVIHNTPAPQILKASECLLSSPRISRILFIDNSPGEDLRKVVEQTSDPRVEYLHVDNRGFGAGHNVAIREIFSHDHPESIPDYHIVMNADVSWSGDVPARLEEYMDSHPDAGMVMPRVWYPDGDLQYACRRLPTPWDLIAKRFLPDFLTRRRMRKYLLADASHDVPFSCPYLLGSFLFFRREALLEAEGFDERFFMYPEDIDITRRIHRHWDTMFWPGVDIIHEHAAASRRSGRMLRIHMENMIRYFNKWGWLRDRERREFNRRLDRTLTPAASDAPKGRG